MLFFWISLDLDLRSQVISWSLLVPSCNIIFTYKKLTPPILASGITTFTFLLKETGLPPSNSVDKGSVRETTSIQSLSMMKLDVEGVGSKSLVEFSLQIHLCLRV